MENYMTAKEVAKAVGLSEQTIRRYVLNKEIPYHKIFRAVRFKPSEIEKWVENNQTLLDEGREENIDGGLFDEAEAVEAGGLDEGTEGEHDG